MHAYKTFYTFILWIWVTYKILIWLITQVGQKLAMVEQEVEIAEDRANTGEM